MFEILKLQIQKTIFYKLFKKFKAQFAGFFYGHPSDNMFIVGVTGTDGKTTTVNLIHNILQTHCGKTLLLSTANIKYGDIEIPNTTKMSSLDPRGLQKHLAKGKLMGCNYAVIEVTSHGLDQYRFQGIEFDVGVLTNITAEHLDYHKTIDQYAESKKKLFISILKNSKPNKYAILPKDNEWGRKWYDEICFDKVIDYGIMTGATLRADINEIKEYIDHTEISLKYLGKSYQLNSHLLGKFNVYNILAACSVGIILGIKIDVLLDTITNFTGVTGRMERYEAHGINYFVDFAHTPNGLESVLKFLATIKGKGKIILVFGATGNRDKFKRPQMAAIAVRYADVTIITDDDPDTEDRYHIIGDIINGLPQKLGHNTFAIPERQYAIKFATQIALPGDIVIFAGKGHETMQLTNFGRRSWSDRQQLFENININLGTEQK